MTVFSNSIWKRYPDEGAPDKKMLVWVVSKDNDKRHILSFRLEDELKSESPSWLKHSDEQHSDEQHIYDLLVQNLLCSGFA